MKEVIKNGVTNFTKKELAENRIRVLNLGPQFFPTFNIQRPCMHIIQATENYVLKLQNDNCFKKPDCGKVLARYYQTT